jgi:hypothetical protein
MWYWEALKQKDDAESIVKGLPQYYEGQVFSIKNEDKELMPGNPKGFKAIVRKDTGSIVAVPTGKYTLVQHEEAFMPIVEALNSLGQPFKIAAIHSNTNAWLNILTTETDDGVSVGFQAMNSVDGSTSLQYGFANFKATRYIELVGYRQVCSNGMVVRVPIDNADFVRLEEREKIEVLLRQSIRIIHTGKAQEKIEQIRYLVEAMALLKEPVARMIKAATMKGIGQMEAEELLKKYIGKRLKAKLLGQFEQEEKTLWGLYNAITFVAAHDNEIKTSTKNSLITKSADLLLAEVQ